MSLFRIASAFVLSATAAAAQQEDWSFSNPLQGGNVAATCDNWAAQQQSADPYPPASTSRISPMSGGTCLRATG